MYGRLNHLAHSSPSQETLSASAQLADEAASVSDVAAATSLILVAGQALVVGQRSDLAAPLFRKVLDPAATAPE
jgi:hypothetical protein